MTESMGKRKKKKKREEEEMGAKGKRKIKCHKKVEEWAGEIRHKEGNKKEG